ncbi:hypothetical protein EBR66_08025 [bacterium]|nr:hypothetical protein [bacterium]
MARRRLRRNDTILKRYKQLEGLTLAKVVADKETFPGDTLYGFVFKHPARPHGLENVMWLLADPEGNGPGYGELTN